MMPAWLKGPHMLCALVPPEIADNNEAIVAHVDRSHGIGNVGSISSWQVMSVVDLRFREASVHTARGMREKSIEHRVLSLNQGKFEVRVNGSWQEKVLRVLTLQGMSPPAQVGKVPR